MSEVVSCNTNSKELHFAVTSIESELGTLIAYKVVAIILQLLQVRVSCDCLGLTRMRLDFTVSKDLEDYLL